MLPSTTTAALLAETSGHHFHIEPWIIIPILMLAAIIATIGYVVKDGQKRRPGQHPG
jgi:hypothetical protein